MLPDGKHDLRVHASDIVGNDAEKTFSFTVDNTPPEILVKITNKRYNSIAIADKLILK